MGAKRLKSLFFIFVYSSYFVGSAVWLQAAIAVVASSVVAIAAVENANLRNTSSDQILIFNQNLILCINSNFDLHLLI